MTPSHHPTLQESNVTVLVASRLFADEYLMKCLDPVFAKELKFYYNSDVQGVPFSKDPPTAWKAVNTFVEEKTNGIVSDFMKRFVICKARSIPIFAFEIRFSSSFHHQIKGIQHDKVQQFFQGKILVTLNNLGTF